MPNKFERMSRRELEAESNRLAKERTAIREQQVEVDGLLDAHRQLDALNIPPENIAQLHRVAQLRAKGQTEAQS